MWKLKYIILHCADTPCYREVTKEDIEHWHLGDKEQGGRGWSRVGYSKMFQRSGNVVDFIKQNSDQWIDSSEISNGAKGYNGISVHWCFAGGRDKENKTIIGQPDEIITDAQFLAFRNELNDFLKYHPQVKIIGHNQVSSKSCPNFKVDELLKLIGVPKKYILKGDVK